MRQGHEIDTKKIQRKVYLTYFQDGLWDVVLGLFLLGWGFTVWFDLPWLPGATFVAFFWLVLALKQKITYPRIGFVKLAEHKKKQVRFVITGVIALLLGLMVFLLLVMGGTPQFVRDYFELLFGTILAVVIGLIGYWWGIVRWYNYAGLVFVLATFNQWLGLSFELSFIIPGGVVLLFGLVVFTRFLRKYSRLPAEGIDEA
ncbi:hypothetical protein ACFLWC_02660 [Chloroflexota bacterium]